MELRFLSLALAACLGACTPTLNWREMRIEGSGLVAMFPCKPDVLARRVSLADASVRMTLAACRAGGVTFAVAFADMPEAAQIGPALVALKESASRNFGISDAKGASREWQVKGMTPNPQTQRMSFQGKGADGKPLKEEAGFFSRGTRVFQATILGPSIEKEAADTFFDGLNLL